MKPGPGRPSSSIQHSRAVIDGADELATDEARVLGEAVISFDSGDNATEVWRLEAEDLEEAIALEERVLGCRSFVVEGPGASGETRRFLVAVCGSTSSFFRFVASLCRGGLEDEGVGCAVTLIVGALVRGSEERGTATTRVVTTVDVPAEENLGLEKKERSVEDARDVEDEAIVDGEESEDKVVVGVQNVVSGGELLQVSCVNSSCSGSAGVCCGTPN